MESNKKQKLLEKIESLRDELSKQRLVISKFLTLIGVSKIIISSLDKKEVIQRILEQTKILMDCKQSSVMLIDPETDCLYFEHLANKEEFEILKDVRLKKGEGIAGTVWEKNKSILVENATKDNRFSNKADKKLDNITQSLIASPLAVEKKIIGVMEAINKNDETSFNHFDLKVFETLSNHAATAIYNAKLYEMAITDGMTKLFIKKYFLVRLEEEVKRAKRYERDISLLMLDIDYFKKFNDSYGHQFGDEVLINIARLLIDNCRTTDLPARYGGEEFAIILPETNKNGAITFAERIRKMVEKKELKFENKKIKITISIGITSFNENPPNNYEKFINMADKALYYSKNNGRNRVSFYKNNMK